MAGYRIKIYRKKARWNGNLGYLTEKSQQYEKLIVDFVAETGERVYWSWMPRNDDVVSIVAELLKETGSDDFREKIFAVLNNHNP